MPMETGGLLLGYWAEDQAVVVEATTPGPDAGFAVDRYVPDGRWDEMQVAAVYERTGGLITYLGDWHSHPDGRRRLSALDRATIANISGDTSARAPRALMAICTVGEPPCVSFWVVREMALSRRRLTAARTLTWPRFRAADTWSGA